MIYLALFIHSKDDARFHSLQTWRSKLATNVRNDILKCFAVIYSSVLFVCTDFCKYLKNYEQKSTSCCYAIPLFVCCIVLIVNSGKTMHFNVFSFNRLRLQS